MDCVSYWIFITVSGYFVDLSVGRRKVEWMWIFNSLCHLLKRNFSVLWLLFAGEHPPLLSEAVHPGWNKLFKCPWKGESAPAGLAPSVGSSASSPPTQLVASLTLTSWEGSDSAEFFSQPSFPFVLSSLFHYLSSWPQVLRGFY